MSRKPTLLILFFDTLIWLTIVAPLILGGIYWQIGGKDRGLYNASLGAVCVVFLFLFDG